MQKARNILRYVIGLVVLLGIGRLFNKQSKRPSVEQPEQPTVVNAQPDAEHEFQDASPRGIAMVGFGMLAMLVITYLIVWGMFSYFNARQTRADQAPPPLAATPQAAEGPRLQVNPPLELQTALAGERERLNTYEWVDRDAGVVRIPIERAMELMAQPGRIPARSVDEAPFVNEAGHELESEGGQEAEGTSEPALEATLEPETEATPESTSDDAYTN